MDSFYSKKEEEKKFTRETVKHFLPIYALLCSEEEGKTYGYSVVKNLERDFHMLFSPSEVYPSGWLLEKNGFFTSKIVQGKRGKPRREYHPIEPKTSKYLNMTLEVTNMIVSKLNTMKRNLERDSLNLQVITPEAIERVNKWRTRVDFD